MGEPNYAKLDPGIREVVRLLRSWGYDTIRSGEAPAYVQVKPQSAESYDESRGLQGRLVKAGIPLGTFAVDLATHDGSTVISVTHLNDAGLPKV